MVRSMIQQNACESFSTNEIKPKGWLLDQLRIQAGSLSGNLDKIWPDIRESKWIGGDREGWERVPYWLDGFIPLAYLLEDKDMIACVRRYVDAILKNQQEDGWICPCTEEERPKYDIWAMFLIGKVFVQYYECSKDERIESALYRALKNINAHIKRKTVFNWASARWFECLIPIFWLYGRVQEEWLVELAVSLYSQGFSYKNLFENWRDQLPRNEWNFQTHVVNMAMALKSEALMSRITGDDSNAFALKMIGMLQKYHGTAVGHFNGDECLSGNSPIQGTELCGVVEAMYSYEVLFAVTGKTAWLDRLEMLAYNALPATISPDMWTHQYDQMVNQIACVKFKDKPTFRTNTNEANIFGFSPDFGCCTSNFNQGWPKFALSTFYKKDGGILSASLSPSIVSTEIKGVPVSVELETLYPFRDNLTYIVRTSKEVDFNLDIRIPGWVTAVKVDGRQISKRDRGIWGESTDARNDGILTIGRSWCGERRVAIEFEMETVFDERPENLTCLRRGPLVYAVSIEEEWTRHEYVKDGVERKFPYCDYEIRPKSAWNYAFTNGKLEVVTKDDFDRPFSSEHPPITIIADMAEIDWGFEEGHSDEVCARVPHSREPKGDVRPVVLKPYGCTNLRMTEIPKLG